MPWQSPFQIPNIQAIVLPLATKQHAVQQHRRCLIQSIVQAIQATTNAVLRLWSDRQSQEAATSVKALNLLFSLPVVPAIFLK